MNIQSKIMTSSSVMTQETKGMLLGAIGVAMFSLTLPFTRIAVAELHPVFVAVSYTHLTLPTKA